MEIVKATKRKIGFKQKAMRGFITLKKDFKRNKYIYLMLLPVVLYYLIFHYGPMTGIVVAFKRFSPKYGIWGSEWVGLKYFKDFLTSIYFWRLFKNTLVINFYNLLFGFPAPIIFALLINEIRNKRFKKSVQTITYLPHFISVVVICGLLVDFTSTNGIINDLIVFFGGERFNLLANSDLFRGIFVSSNIWQNIGWGTIIYLAALSAIDPGLYEAANIDGCGRFKQAIHITLPGIAPTIAILFIMRIGKMMQLGWQKIILLYSPLTYETADVISTFVYRKGLIEANYSYSSAVGLFNAIINFILLLSANKISRKLKSTSLW